MENNNRGGLVTVAVELGSCSGRIEFTRFGCVIRGASIRTAGLSWQSRVIALPPAAESANG